MVPAAFPAVSEDHRARVGNSTVASDKEPGGVKAGLEADSRLGSGPFTGGADFP
jgi:hypothetical protein